MKFFGQQPSTDTGRAGPNKRGGAPTKYGDNYVYNPDDPCTIYSVPIVLTFWQVPQILQAAGYILPSMAGKPAVPATYYWDTTKGPCPDPGIAPPITAQEEQQILAQTMPIQAPEPSFLSRNLIPIVIGGGVLFLSIIGMVLLVKV